MALGKEFPDENFVLHVFQSETQLQAPAHDPGPELLGVEGSVDPRTQLCLAGRELYTDGERVILLDQEREFLRDSDPAGHLQKLLLECLYPCRAEKPPQPFPPRT